MALTMGADPAAWARLQGMLDSSLWIDMAPEKPDIVSLMCQAQARKRRKMRCALRRGLGLCPVPCLVTEGLVWLLTLRSPCQPISTRRSV